jgi:hypothetical protein
VIAPVPAWIIGGRFQGTGLIQPGGQRRDVRILEEIDHADTVAKRRLHGQQPDGVAAEIEEVVVHTHLVEPQHVLPDSGYSSFGRCAWPRVRTVQFRPGRRRCGQAGAVELPRPADRQPVHRDDDLRQHVAGQPFIQPGAQFARTGRRSRVTRHVCHDRRSGAGVPADDRRLADVRMSRQHRLDLPQLDAEATYLDLRVGPSEEGELSVRLVPDQVSGAVEPRTRRPERIGDESLRGQAGTCDVAATHALAAQVQLAGHAERHRPHTAVQDIRAAVGHRPADLYWLAGPQLGARSVHGRLARPVRVDQPPAGRRPLGRQFGRACLAADDKRAQLGQRAGRAPY